MAVLVVAGFWPTYFQPLFAGTLDLKPIVEIHAVVYLGWIVLLLTQALLAFSRRLNWHRKLGWFTAGYAGLMVVVVLMALVQRFSRLVASGEVREAHQSLVVSGVDLLLFIGFLVPAILYRKKPQIHKRLIIVATVVLMGPAAGRLTFLTPGPLMLAVMLSPILLGIVFDIATRRRAHMVYVTGLILFVASMARLPLQNSETWLSFSMWVHRLFT